MHAGAGQAYQSGFHTSTAETSRPRKEIEVTAALHPSPLRGKNPSCRHCVFCWHGGKHCASSHKWQRSGDGMREDCVGQKAVDYARHCIEAI